jgi:branched-subunit amino acid ABC-type transport system permease component
VFALDFILLFGVNHIMNMAYGSLFMWGSFAGLYASRRGGRRPWLREPIAAAPPNRRWGYPSPARGKGEKALSMQA